jgi:hypothetical protein
MSRAINLAMAEDAIIKHCDNKGIDISVLEALPDGGMRLVCSSADGAEQIRSKLKRHMMGDDARRAKFRPRTPLW